MPQHFQHAFDEVAVGLGGAGAGVFLAVPFPVDRGRDGCFKGERAGDAGDALDLLRPVHQHFFLCRLVVGDAFQGDVRHNAADFLALLVLLALVDKAAGRAAAVVAQFIEREGRGQQPLPRQRQRHAAGVHGDPAPPPLLRHIRRRPAAAGGIEYEVAGVRGH
ncbi:MAG: hypothetical protein WC789_12450 [Lentisphaeria bacterium]